MSRKVPPITQLLAKGRKRLEESALQTKLIFAYGCMLLLVFALNIVMFMQIGNMIGSMDQAYESNVQISALQQNMQNVQNDLYSYLNGNRDTLKQYYADRNNLESGKEQLHEEPSYNAIHLLEKDIRGLLETYLECAENAVSAYRGADIEKYTAYYEQATTIYNYLETNIYTLSNQTFAENTSQFQQLSQIQYYTRFLNIALLLFASLIEILVIMLVTRQLVGPLGRLAERAGQIGEGKLNIPPLRVRSLDEVGKVTSAFNAMVVRLNEYILLQQEQLREENRLKEEQLKLEGYLKDSQLGALQAQINPHFLYNTLNAGSQLAMIEGAEQTSVFLERVAGYFRYNLHKAGRDVSLAEEIAQAENYIFIMNTRFAGDIHFSKNVADTLPEVRLPGMVLQPVVENAIEHGLRDIEEGEKRLTISVVEEWDHVSIRIEDNGKIFPEEKAREILERTDDILARQGERQHGIGMANVVSRLRLFYDREDVMTIGTMEDKTGCCVELLIPLEG